MITDRLTTWVRETFGSNSITAFGYNKYTAPPVSELPYTYTEMQKLMTDDRIYSIVCLMSSMVASCYKGIDILPEDYYTDNTLDDDERKIINEAIRFTREIDIEELFFTYTWNMLAYGDYVEKIIYDKNGIVRLEPLPLNNLIILDTESDTNDTERLITEKNFYYIKNEADTKASVPIKAEDVIHVSYNNRGQWRKDRENRDTFNVWSIPPIAPLKALMDWKDNTIKMDIKWKQRMVPREHWQMDLDYIQPTNYTGTIEEKVQKAKEAITQEINNFKQEIDQPAPDQSIITTKTIEGNVMESSSTSYSAPNETLEQINNYLGTTTGIPDAYLGGKSDGYAGLSSVNIINGLRVEIISKKIKRELEKVIRKHLYLKQPGLASQIDRIIIQVSGNSVQLDLENSKVLMNFASSGLFSKEELRRKVGYGPTSQELYSLKNDERRVRDSEEQVVTDVEKQTDNEDSKSPQAQTNDLTKR